MEEIINEKIKKVNEIPFSNLRDILSEFYKTKEKEVTLNFNFSYKEWFDLKDKLTSIVSLESIGDYSYYNNSVLFIFEDLKFRVHKAVTTNNIVKRTIDIGDKNSFYFSSIDSFCGGFQVSNFSDSFNKEELNFLFQFILEEYYEKSRKYGNLLNYPIYFFDKEEGYIYKSLSNINIKGKLTRLNSYINPNSGNSVGVFFYQFEK